MDDIDIKNNQTDIAGISRIIRNDDLESEADLKEIENKIVNGDLYVEEDNVISVKEKFHDICKQIIGGEETYEQENPPNYAPSHSEMSDYDPYDVRTRSHRSAADSVLENPISKPHREYLDDEDYYSYHKRTNEEKTSAALKNYLKNDDHNDAEFNLGYERLMDDKLIKLEEIESLKSQLNLKKEDMEQYNVNKEDDYNVIKGVWERLRHKSELEQYDYLLTQAIEFGAGMIERLFDGKRDYFGYRPDMTDWSSSVKLKLKRMKPQKTKVVSGLVQNYKMNDGTSILLQLLLSGILYSQTKNRHADDEDYEDYTTNREYRTAMQDMDDD